LQVFLQVGFCNSVLRLTIGLWFRGLPLEAVERRAEIVEHGGEVASQCGTTAD
jgi:hypothetical protein